MEAYALYLAIKFVVGIVFVLLGINHVHNETFTQRLMELGIGVWMVWDVLATLGIHLI